MDKKLRREIVETIKKAIAQAQEEQNERYLSSEDLSKQFGMFTKDWISRYGKYLPREQVTVESADGRRTSTRWGYPMKKIARMLRTGMLQIIKTNE